MNDAAEFAAQVGTAQRPRRTGRPEVAAPAPQPSSSMEPQSGHLLPEAELDARARWSGNGEAFWASAVTLERLPPAVYTCNSSPNGPFVQRTRISTDHLLTLPDTATESVVAEIRRFWSLRSEFEKRGFLHKRGIMLFGPPGGGKTSCVSLLIDLIVRENGGVGLLVDHPGLAGDCLQMIRRVEPERPIIVILEDLDALVERHGENGYLALLDGEGQVGGVVNIATTNYPERLDRRFVDRPSRFDTINRIGMPSAAARRVYLRAKEPALSESDLEKCVRLSNGFSIAHLRELIILTCCFKRDIEGSAKQLRDMMEAKPNSAHDPEGASFGFTGSFRSNGAADPNASSRA